MMRIALLVSGCLLAFSAFAAEEPTIELEPVDVTGQKTVAPPINWEAISKTEFQREELTERGLTRLQDVSKNVANFSLTDQGMGSFGQINNLRGLVNAAIFGTPAVVFYVDDVAYSSPINNMGWLFDVESVSVYRDSQPGRFGKNAYAGAVEVQSRQPSNQLKAGLNFGVSSFDNYLVNVKSSGALLKDQLFFSLSGVYQRSNGFLSNNFLHNHPGSEENFSGRASLTWKPNTAWDIRLSLSKDDFDYGNARFVTYQPSHSFTTHANTAETFKQVADSQALRIAFEGDDYKLLSVTSHRFWQTSPLLMDLDLSPDFSNSLEHNLYDETWTQELRLSPKARGDWDWHLGGFYSTTFFRGSVDLRIPIAGRVNYWDTQRTTDNYALFGQLAYQGIKDLKLYTDLRLDYVHSQMSGILDQTHLLYLENRHYDTVFASPKWGMDYRFSEHGLLYASTGLSFKAGGLTHASADPRFVAFKQENLWHNTVGIKTDWLNQRLTSNLSAFYYQIKNYQIERGLANGNYETFNAPRVTSYGFELENRAKLVENLYLENSVGYTHSRIDSYHDLITGANYRGNRVPFVPDFNAITALQYKDSEGYFARAEWVWKGKTYFSEAENELLSQRDYHVINLRIGYAKHGYSGYLYANNVTDSYYYTFKEAGRGAPGTPRVIGAQLGYEF